MQHEKLVLEVKSAKEKTSRSAQWTALHDKEAYERPTARLYSPKVATSKKIFAMVPLAKDSGATTLVSACGNDSIDRWHKNRLRNINKLSNFYSDPFKKLILPTFNFFLPYLK